MNDYSRLIKNLDSILKIVEDFREENSPLFIEYKSYIFSETDWNGTDIWLILHQDWFKDMMKVWFDVEVRFEQSEYVILSWE